MIPLLLLVTGLCGTIPALVEEVSPDAAAPANEPRHRPLRLTVMVVWAFLVMAVGVVAAAWFLRLGLWGVGAAVLVPVAWVLWGTYLPRSAPVGRVVALIVAVGVLLGLAGGDLTALHGGPGRAAASRLCAVIGVVLLMIDPANRVVAGILERARGSSPEPGGRGCPPEAGAVSTPLRGGRWIGALERLLIVALATGGAQAALAAVIAAKGVIRFPEISKDEGGQKAEEFLIGSLASWILAALGAGILLVV